MKDGAVAEKSTVEEDSPANEQPQDGARSPAGSAATAAAQTEKTGLVGLIDFLNQTRLELTKISWPDRNQVVRETLSVIVLVTIITGLVIGFDIAVAKVVFEPLDHFARHLGGGIGAH